MADKPPTAMPPSSEPFPGSRTPGWNDPPTLAYNPLSASSGGGPGRPRISLNKRVAYPLQGTVTPTTTSTKPMAVVLPNQASAGLPPPPPPTTATIMQPVAVVHPMPHTTSEQENITLPTDAVSTSFRSLRERVPLVQESINVRREEIERRLGVIEQLWQTGNLSPAVQQKIYRLSQAVSRRSYNEAMEIYTSLVANHANECTTWAVTLRHIVLTIPVNDTATASTELLSNAATTTSITASNNAIGSSNLVTAVPTMSVTAMPRSSTEENPLSSSSSSNSTSSSAASRVQHI
ncbi:steroid receptor RNA activator 1 [Calliphora vicina]|uniref:steroid receptor RNA activator 1 n=1 Tax=Calliphora vicina TaxID=7373 RepID=UPI00325BDE75